MAQLLYWLTQLVQDQKVPVWVKTTWRLIRIFILTTDRCFVATETPGSERELDSPTISPVRKTLK